MDQKSTATSLLSLNEYCLLDIFKFLDLPDLVNLVKTCKKLKFICARVCARKYKEIEVQVYLNKGMNKELFTNTLSVIGKHISSVSVNNPNQFSLQLIKEKCKNIRIIKLWERNGPIELQIFENLKELSAAPISPNELKSCFTKNPELESLEYGSMEYGEDFVKLLEMLPKLQTLHLHNVPNSFRQNLHCFKSLTKFILYSLENCNQLLMELTTNSQLKELQLWKRLDTDTFDIIKSFTSLEVLSMRQYGPDAKLPENMVFPSTLKSLEMTSVTLSYKTFLETVKTLKSLEEFDLGYQDSLDKYLNFNDSTVIRQIEVGLRAELASRQRPLKIIYFDYDTASKHIYIHCSPKLHIMSWYAAHMYNRPKPQLITVASPV